MVRVALWGLDVTLPIFNARDELSAAWKIFTPILHAIDRGELTPLEYPAGMETYIAPLRGLVYPGACARSDARAPRRAHRFTWASRG